MGGGREDGMRGGMGSHGGNAGTGGRIAEMRKGGNAEELDVSITAIPSWRILRDQRVSDCYDSTRADWFPAR